MNNVLVSVLVVLSYHEEVVEHNHTVSWILLMAATVISLVGWYNRHMKEKAGHQNQK